MYTENELYILPLDVLAGEHQGTSKYKPQANEVLWVTKWVDYSNKYGFGYQLSDRTVGVMFNDKSRISFSPDRR